MYLMNSHHVLIYTIIDLAVLQESEGQDVVGVICEQLCQIVRILHNLVRSADIPSKGRSQDLFKCLQKFYSVLEQLTKHVCLCV